VSTRLPPIPGEWIDRTKPVTFQFEGQAVSGFAGDVVTSALWAAGMQSLGRSFKYHRPRGVLSFANHDVNVLLEDAAHINLRGDVTPLVQDMDLAAVNTFGSAGVKRDRAAILDRLSGFLPVGFYYKAFYRPKWLAPRWEAFFRFMRPGQGEVRCTSRRHTQALRFL
jgi:sarcosine oxidase, subunit alpha